MNGHITSSSAPRSGLKRVNFFRIGLSNDDTFSRKGTRTWRTCLLNWFECCLTGLNVGLSDYYKFSDHQFNHLALFFFNNDSGILALFRKKPIHSKGTTTPEKLFYVGFCLCFWHARSVGFQYQWYCTMHVGTTANILSDTGNSYQVNRYVHTRTAVAWYNSEVKESTASWSKYSFKVWHHMIKAWKIPIRMLYYAFNTICGNELIPLLQHNSLKRSDLFSEHAKLWRIDSRTLKISFWTFGILKSRHMAVKEPTNYYNVQKLTKIEFGCRIFLNRLWMKSPSYCTVTTRLWSHILDPTNQDWHVGLWRLQRIEGSIFLKEIQPDIIMGTQVPRAVPESKQHFYFKWKHKE